MSLSLKQVRIRGFKSLKRVDLLFPGKIVVLVGANGTGKSSILQAIAFLQYFSRGNPESFFEDRGWNAVDARSKVDGSSSIIGFNIHLSDGEKDIAWGINWSISAGRTTNESIWVRQKESELPKKILSYARTGGAAAVGEVSLKGIRPFGSVLSVVDLKLAGAETGALLDEIHRWANGIFSLELLSPTAMRRGTRGAKTDIGPRGERLGGFLASLSPERKERIVARLSRFFPVRELETTKKKAGWIDLKIQENYDGLSKISAAHMSDGFMRLLGLAAIPEFSSDSSMVLLDEIEDGVDHHALADFVQMISQESSSQLLMTTHSPILLNSIRPEDISFIARDEVGGTHAAQFSDLDPMMSDLEYLGTGEVWSQTSVGSISRQVLEINKKEEEARGKASMEGEAKLKTESESVQVFLERAR